MASFKPEVLVGGKWSSNALRFATFEEALNSARDLMGRWMAVEDARAVPSHEDPNYTYHGHTLEAIET